ncbi:ribose-phosphate pyrophosphokinase [Chitinimonas sp. BJYL2]|uniref:ribose-phosphate pyrophosphokinase n=1 Tax=Chitinimonas sp. BJYL2 TaxID=2976696 RepID=UPI0022B56589|nr:ribose-phosphate pyrophosphokinase [Chitinimonas sp. BJYL2]
MTDAAAVLLAYPGYESLTEALSAQLGWPNARLTVHHFPDGETLVSVPPDLAGACVVLVAGLDQPDQKAWALLFAADALRDTGVRRIGLLAPYLGYMRQDTRFHPGEAITSRTFADVMSTRFDFLLTVDPHLHRYASLSEIYRNQAVHVSAMSAMADWLRREVVKPVLIGPDSESEQWIAAVAAQIGAPFTVLRKERHGDKSVVITPPELAQYRDHTPVILDDILSTARTMAVVVGQLRETGMPPPVCVAVHALLVGDALDVLMAAGPARVVTCNTVAHATNGIDISPVLAAALPALAGQPA